MSPAEVGSTARLTVEALEGTHEELLDTFFRHCWATVTSRADLSTDLIAANEAQPPERRPELTWSERQRLSVGGTEILSGRVNKALERHVQPEEEVRFCLKGDFDHSLIALGDRLLIIKAGMWAGTTFGARVTTIHYTDVTGIEVNTGLLNCVVEVSTPSYPAVGKKSIWLAGRTSKRDPFNRSPYTESNTIPITRHPLKQWTPYLDELRQLIAAAKGSTAARSETRQAEAAHLPAQLKDLHELHQAGAITDEEFAQAKAQLLGS